MDREREIEKDINKNMDRERRERWRSCQIQAEQHHVIVRLEVVVHSQHVCVAVMEGVPCTNAQLVELREQGIERRGR
jgi:hypothetical protein